MKYVRLLMATLITIFGLSMGWKYVIRLYDQGIFHINYPSRTKYPIVGVDVSHHQGSIEWETLVKEDINFAFIKSTEGSSFVDPRFAENWKNASKTGIKVGAYHFFSFDSSGKTQAELFCKTVKQVDNMLPPVVDVELYGKYKKISDIDIAKAKKELRILIDILEKKYGMKPLIYCGHLYNVIIKDDFQDCDLWYRSIFKYPVNVEDKCVFWQYSDNHILPGYSGREKHIDMNVFIGSKEEFDAYLNE